MPKLLDMRGSEWEFRRITVGDYDDLGALGLDVEAVSDNFELIAELAVKRKAFAGLLWWFVAPAVEAAKLTPQAFYARLDGDTLARAVFAIRDAIIDFFPYPPAEKARLMTRVATAGGDGSDAAGTSSPQSPASTPDPSPSAS